MPQDSESIWAYWNEIWQDYLGWVWETKQTMNKEIVSICSGASVCFFGVSFSFLLPKIDPPISVLLATSIANSLNIREKKGILGQKQHSAHVK